jgi:F-type H+-transporting ATPase subunit gamma
MKSDLRRLEAGKEFGFSAIDKIFASDQYMIRKFGQSFLGNKTLIVPFTSDRGLCGGINTGIVREIKAKIHGSNRNDYGIYVFGEKGTSALIRNFPDLLRYSVSEVPSPLSIWTVASITDNLKPVTKDYDKVLLVYNEFKSAIKSIVRHNEILPRHRFLERMKVMKVYKLRQHRRKVVNPALFDLYFTSNLYVAILNSIASEQSARMSAMENASKNAKEIVEKLKLEYNKARQQKITLELCEIISGAAAV